MAQAIRLLIVEDAEADALLLVLELSKGGVVPDFVRVETLQELESALDSGPWDAVIADFNLPGFTGLDALRIVQSKGLDLPFILVSGVINEEQAIEAMRAGAHDFILKGRLARLAPALERELREAAMRRERQKRTFELRNANEALQSEIDERKRVEAVLRESEESFRAIFEQAAVGIGEVTPDGSWLRVNRKLCEILGYTEDELKALSFRDVTHPSDQETSLKHSQLLMDGRLANYILEKRYVRKDGSTIWANLTVSSVCDADGNVKYSVGIVEDISERKRAEEKIDRLNADLTARAVELEAVNKKLEDLNRELEAFNYTVAHDLRNPLNVISSYCQVFKEMCGDQLQEDCMGYVQEAYNGVLRMNGLIEVLLKFSHMCQVELTLEMVDLSALAHVVAAEQKLSEPGRQVDFRIADGIAANADANMLRVVLNNLIGNAWKYTGKREGVVIEFGTTEIDGQPTYFVRDNGAGFDKANADKLFAPLQRLPGAEEFRGFGIGLATVERIIRRHGGRIWAEGEPDKGATFWFTLSADGVPN